jgi:hypothetical protein
MEIVRFLLYPLGLVLEVLAIIHFIRRRPDMFWIFIILFLGPLGAVVYLCVEALPEFGLFNVSFKGVPRRKRIRELEATVLDNPSGGNYEELGELYLDEGKLELARSALNKAIAAGVVTHDAFYRRGLCALQLGDAAAAISDLEPVVAKEPDHDFHRASGLLAHAYAQAGLKNKAELQFNKAILVSTLSETYLNYAEMLAAQGRTTEARQWAQKVLDKERTMPGYLRRRELPWFQKANAILKRLPA